MPAITRNMKKNAQNVNSDNIPKVNLLKDVVPIRQCASKSVDPQYSRLPYQPVVIDDCSVLITRIKTLLTSISKPNIDKKNKVIMATEIYSLLNSEMMKHPKLYGSNRFVLTVFNKTFELETSINDKDMISSVDLKILENLRTEIIKIRPTLKSLIDKMDDNMLIYLTLFNETTNNMNKNHRPKRNISRVNYAGMDMNSDEEGEISVCKTKWNNGKPTHYWVKYQASQANEIGDEDYCESEEEPEEEPEDEDEKRYRKEIEPYEIEDEDYCESEDEPEDEEPQDEDEKRYRKAIEPYENEDSMDYEQRLKEVIKRRVTQMESKSRPRRNVQRVNYTGMDMNSDDEGEVSVCKTKWNNGLPSYSWVKYPAAQANEIGDEDYCEE